jgi:hypothetical protein
LNLFKTDLSAFAASFATLFESTLFSAKHFQNLNVSSAAAETTVVPSGDCAMCNTLAVWPVNSAIFVIVGYFHKHN